MPSCTIEGGKFWALASGGTTGICTTNGVAGSILFKGGVYNVNTTLSKHIPEGYEEVPLASDRTEYGEGYRYEVDKAGMHGIDVCQIGSTKYKSLEEALQVVTSGQTIYMIANYTMAMPGDYVLPSGATLLIPYKDGTGRGASTAIGATAVTTDAAVTPSLFRKLTFANGVNLICNGIIETSAQQKANGQYDAWVGMPSGAYGQIELQEGSHIELENGAKLYCWGYITGKGTINCKKGSTSLEGFQLGDWCGGTNYGLRGLGSNSNGVFPITHYAYQSIECPITYRPGSRAMGSTHVVVSGSTYGTDNIALVGTSGSMFVMDDNDASADTWVLKDYDETTDQCVWTINSGASIGNLNINISGYNINSGNFYMPITTNMSVIINYGNMGIAQNTVFLPGSKLVINKEGTAVVNGIKVVAYDASDWTGTTIYRTNYSPSWGTANPGSTTAKDAEWFVHGKVSISGNGGVYTTASGANIHSTNADAGQVIYNSTAQGNITNHYYLQQGGTTMTKITVNPAKLYNEDATYSETSGTSSGDIWVYENGKWTNKTIEGCFSVETTDIKHYFIQPADVVEVNYPAQSNHTYTSVTGGRVFVWDEDCYWWEVETDPTPEGYYKAITPDHNGKYNYYYYDSSAACWKIKTITVTWNINGSNTNYSVGYGTKPEWLGATPTKASSSSNYVWRWDGWTKGSDATVLPNNDLPIVTENTTFTAHFYEKYYEYNVTFKNSDGTILESKNWIAGTTPSYEGTPTKNPTVDYTYEFNGTWSPAIQTVTGSATYTAQYTATSRAYTITFLNYDMSVLGTAEVVYNGTPSNVTYKAAIAPSDFEPYKPDNNAYSFEFTGWRLQGASENGFAQVKGNQTYVAQFAETTKKYRITFLDADGETVLHWTQLEYDAMPSYDGPATSGFNKQDAEWDYTFSGWTPAEFTAVQGPQTYTATYSKEHREYTITWLNDDNSLIDKTKVVYGEVPTHADATKTSTAEWNYTFTGWDKTPVAVTEDATYKATFSAEKREYTITWKNGDATIEIDSNVPYGTTPSFDSATPAKAATAQYTYTFSGWDPAIVPVAGDATYTAQFNQTARPYTITWLNYDGSPLKSTTSYWGETPAYSSYNETPTYTDAENRKYQFTEWDPEIHEVNSDVNVYTAQYERIDDLVITKEEPIKENTTLTTTTVRVEGKLNVETNAKLTTDDLILEATPTSSGEIIGEVVATQKAYFDLSNGAEGFKARTWYAVAVPWQVEVTAYGSANGVYLTNDGVNYTRQVLGSTFDLLWYDGKERALNGPSDACWVYIEDDQLERHTHYTMLPGRAYMIYLTTDAQAIRFERKEGKDLLNTTAQVQAHPQSTGNAKDANWNGIANPATYHAYMNAASGNKGQIYVAIEDRYEPIEDMSATPLIVGQPVFVQSTETKSVVACVDKSDYASHAPRRIQANDNAGGSIEVRIGRTENSYTDRLYISMDKYKEDTYLIGEDLAKAGVSNKVAQMWVERYDARLCANTAFAPNGTAVYPLGISVPQTGEYTIYLPNGENENDYVFLTLNGRVIWNLSYAPYVADIAAGTTNVYGLKRVRNNAPAVTTDTEDLNVNEHETVRKYLIDNKVYIMRNGVMYSVTGQKVQ